MRCKLCGKDYPENKLSDRQFGIMVTTSYVHKQAYEEVIEDQHPILIISASDIARILRQNPIMSSDVKDWLSSLDDEDRMLRRLNSYYNAINQSK